MELLQLQYFQKVAKSESMTKAAKELYIAQPSLSKTISRLEEQVGVELFDRTGKKIRLNEAGKRFSVRVEKCLRELEDGIKEARDFAEQREEQITVGAATAKLLPGLIRDYMTENPNVKFRFLQVTNHDDLLRMLSRGEIDICISSLPLRKKGIDSSPLTEEKIYLAVSKNHPFARKKEIRLREIEKEPLIHYTAECGLREIIGNFCEEAEVTPHISCECTTPEVIGSLIEAGIGISFLPECLRGAEYTKKLVWIPVKEPELKRTIWISRNEERYHSKAVTAFQSFVSHYFQNQNVK